MASIKDNWQNVIDCVYFGTLTNLSITADEVLFKALSIPNLKLFKV